MEVEKARVMLDQDQKDLAANADYKKLIKEVAQAKKDYAAKCTKLTDVQTKIHNAQAKNDLATKNYRFRKAELDAARYRYEHAMAFKSSDLAKNEADFKALQKLVDQLNLEVEESKTVLKNNQKIIDDCGAQLKRLEKQERQITTKQTLVERKLHKIDANDMSMTDQIANMVRNWPVVELANPTYKVKQIVLKDIRDDINYTTVPKVERCTTCHLGILNPKYSDENNPFKTHPDLSLFLGKNSPHPLNEFGCTVCHGGRGRGTTFNSAAHVPHSLAQEKEWERKYGYKPFELWDHPMYPLPYTEAGCFQCHMGKERLKGAEELNLGLNLIEKSGCYECHNIDKYKGWPQKGPDLTKLASKLSEDWAYKWIYEPQSFRSNAGMPSYFNVANNSDPASQAHAQQEVHAIVHYLFKNSHTYAMKKMPPSGDPEKGEKLVSSIGCFACHLMDDGPKKGKTTAATLARRQGPNLANLGSKTSKEWLYNWLKNPTGYHAETRMPNMRLSDEEAADIAAFLVKDTNSKFDKENIPPVNEKIINDMVIGFLRGSQTDAQAKASLTKMSLDEKLTYAGKKLIAHYGCYSCHNIPGFMGKDKPKPIGVDLTTEGDKALHKLDFGFVDIDHTKLAWFKQKVLHPRSYDEGKVVAWKDKLRMPNFHFTDQEADAIVTALLGFVSDKPVAKKIEPRTPENLRIEEGEKIIAQLNCTGCHIINGDGGYIAKTVTQWLAKYEGKTNDEAKKETESFSPPNLIGIGAKLNPQWLFEFLHSPTTKVRPWLKVRMPTFNFNEAHLDALVKYFNTLDHTRFPFQFKQDTHLTEKEYEAAKKLFSDDYLGCTQCHVVGNQLPSGSQDSWAPNLALAKTRLNPAWIIRWIKNPSALKPGTRMPTFFDPADYANSGPPDILNGDEDEQIRVLRNFLLTLADKPLATKPKPAPVTKAATPPADNAPAQ